MNLQTNKKFSIDLNSFVPVDKEKAWERVTAHIEKTNNKKRKSLILRTTSVAAAVVAICIVGTIYLFDSKKVQLSEPIAESQIEQTILYGENGEPIVLIDSLTVVNKDGKMALSQQVIAGGASAQMMTIWVPHGKMHSIILADGTKVTLNANSKMTFPSKFDGSERRVTIEGELFFEVTKSKIPFIVSSSKVKIEVFGTEFNVNATDTMRIKTVLVSGSVGVTIDGVAGNVMLKPNEMSIADLKKNTNVVERVDIGRQTAWLTGYFRYQGDDLEQMLGEIGAWHNVNFLFEEETLKKIKMTGSFERECPLEKLIILIEETAKVKLIKTEGGTYRVKIHL